MILIDTHTHLYDESFEADQDQMIQRASDAGVSKMFLPNCDSETIKAMLTLEEKFPTQCYAMMGLHPTYVKENFRQELANMHTWFEKRTFVAVGEIGLDYYWDKTFIAQQKEAFQLQIEWSLHHKIPIVIHTRDATLDTISIVKQYVKQGVKGVFHCFSGSYETAKQIIDMGFYLGIGGVLTYKKAGLQEVAQQIDLKHLVLETDAPYLTPTPHRGKRNESAYTKIIAEKLAEIKNISLEEVASITTQNALELFQIQ
jgi:TatD DNase family protein